METVSYKMKGRVCLTRCPFITQGAIIPLVGSGWCNMCVCHEKKDTKRQEIICRYSRGRSKAYYRPSKVYWELAKYWGYEEQSED